MTRRTRWISLAAACALALSACTSDPAGEDADNSGVGSNTLSALIADADGLDRVSDLLSAAGMADAFDGTAPYTIFAPSDDALDALGDEFAGEEARPALLAILREHVVPGYLTADDITAAIAANDGPVEMQTMGEGTLTLSAEGDTIRVAPTGGDTGATLDTRLHGVNGVVFPIDSVLKELEPAS